MGKPKKQAFGAKQSKEEKKVKVNPFDVVGKGKKKTVISSNAPSSSAALSRKRANETRQKTIGIEYKNFGKTNQIIDRRVAERSSKFSAVEKAEKRFALQRKKLYASKNRFNLVDDKLSDDGFPNDCEKAPIVESDDEENGNLGADLVALANFGGGTFEDRASNIPKSYKSKRSEVLANLIANSKAVKAARQMDKEVQLDKLHDLDDMFVELQKKGNFNLQPSSSKSSVSDSYNIMCRTLQFDGSTPKRPEATKAAEANEKKNNVGSHNCSTVATSPNKEDDVTDRSDSMLEPEIDGGVDSTEAKKERKVKSGRRTMKQKLRKETRGAMKELRKDATYLAKLQNEQRLKASKERNEKTKRILQSLQGQESEYKKRKLKKF